MYGPVSFYTLYYRRMERKQPEDIQFSMLIEAAKKNMERRQRGTNAQALRIIMALFWSTGKSYFLLLDKIFT